MNNLSPAAQKILRADAAVRCLAEWSSVNDPPCHPSDEGWHGCGACINRVAVAAALDALADQSEAVHIVNAPGFSEFDVVLRVSNIHAIANELKAD